MTLYQNKYIKYKDKYLKLKLAIDISEQIQIGGGKTKEIYLVRHGQTEWNKLGKTQGQEEDIELNETGKSEANKTGQYLKKFRVEKKNFDCILSSPMKRCKETTEIICKELNYKIKKIVYLDELKEVKKGNLSGLTKNDELTKKFGKLVMDELNKIKDPIEKYSLNLPINEHKFYDDLIEKTDLGIKGIEGIKELLERVNFIVNYVKISKMY
jgi:bisphosphoglycerate-dependent phosphoglycerate mutase